MTFSQASGHDAPATEHSGYAKIRLVHGAGKSLLVVDAIIVTGTTLTFWLQPRWQYGHAINFLDHDARATLCLAVVDRHGQNVDIEVDIVESDHVRPLPGRSEIYRVKVRGPHDLSRARAGLARVRTDDGIDLQLFHHTTLANKISILKGGAVWGSSWNFAGTRRLLNCSYAYFTSLPLVADEVHLQRIAMASTGRLALVLDQNVEAQTPDVVLEVYRGSTLDRTHTLALWVPAEHIAPGHFYEHHTSVVEYESTHPWIYSVCLTPTGKYRFGDGEAVLEQPDLMAFDYVILGDCRTEDGLVAPYDEENTVQMFELADLGSGNSFEYWRSHANEDLFDGDVEFQLLEDPSE